LLGRTVALNFSEQPLPIVRLEVAGLIVTEDGGGGELTAVPDPEDPPHELRTTPIETIAMW